MLTPIWLIRTLGSDGLAAASVTYVELDGNPSLKRGYPSIGDLQGRELNVVGFLSTTLAQVTPWQCLGMFLQQRDGMGEDRQRINTEDRRPARRPPTGCAH